MAVWRIASVGHLGSTEASRQPAPAGSAAAMQQGDLRPGVADALGQELTDDYDTRAKLFMWKPVSGLLGGGVATLLLLIFQVMYPNDSAQASVYTMLATVIIGAVAYVLLLVFVKERPTQPRAKEGGIPVAAALRRLFANRKYRAYLLMRVPMTVLGLLPYQVASGLGRG